MPGSGLQDIRHKNAAVLGAAKTTYVAGGVSHLTRPGPLYGPPVFHVLARGTDVLRIWGTRFLSMGNSGQLPQLPRPDPPANTPRPAAARSFLHKRKSPIRTDWITLLSKFTQERN